MRETRQAARISRGKLAPGSIFYIFVSGDNPNPSESGRFRVFINFFHKIFFIEEKENGFKTKIRAACAAQSEVMGSVALVRCFNRRYGGGHSGIRPHIHFLEMYSQRCGTGLVFLRY